MKPTPEQEARARQTIADRQVTFEEYIASLPKEARGETCEASDVDRLNAGAMRVYQCLRNLDKWTLPQLAAATGMTPQSASARWREVRRYIEKDGKGMGHREPVPGSPGLFTYRIQLAKYFGAA